MRISQEFRGYNARRYSRPWISVITSWPTGGKPEIRWGSYLGDDAGGEVEIEAQPGDIIRTGQKDGRGGKTSADWYIVQADGSLDSTDAAGARAAWNGRDQEKPAPAIDLTGVSDADLITEIRRRNLTI